MARECCRSRGTVAAPAGPRAVPTVGCYRCASCQWMSVPSTGVRSMILWADTSPWVTKESWVKSCSTLSAVSASTTMNAPESSAYGPEVITVFFSTRSASQARCAARCSSRPAQTLGAAIRRQLETNTARVTS